MTTKFTPGPWVAEPNTNSDGPHVPGSYKIHHLGTRQWVATQVTERDSSLIASAPDLYAALAAVVACVDRPGGSIRTVTAEAIIEARAALKRARGEE